MKNLKKYFALALAMTLFTSCYQEVIIEETQVVEVTAPTLADVLNSYELWYIDVDRTQGGASIPFMQIAFTLSFQNGVLYANNNLVGFGEQGNGLGIDVGYYDTYQNTLEINHDIDGLYAFEVRQRNDFEIELYFPQQNTRYILEGYQRNTFDYNAIFYRNIHYFLQEYVTWEKVYTSDYGALNEFDNENFVAFLPGGGDGNFQSSQDPYGTDIYTIFWDYTGIYNVDDVPGNPYLKYLTLDYDFLGNEYFELSVINDQTIELFHEFSGTLYRFKGRGYIEFKNNRGKLRKSKATIEKEMKKISSF